MISDTRHCEKGEERRDVGKRLDVLADIVLTALERQRQYGAFVEFTANAVQLKQTHCTVLNAARRVYEKEIGRTTKAINDLIKACEGDGI